MVVIIPGAVIYGELHAYRKYQEELGMFSNDSFPSVFPKAGGFKVVAMIDEWNQQRQSTSFGIEYGEGDRISRRFAKKYGPRITALKLNGQPSEEDYRMMAKFTHLVELELNFEGGEPNRLLKEASFKNLEKVYWYHNDRFDSETLPLVAKRFSSVNQLVIFMPEPITISADSLGLFHDLTWLAWENVDLQEDHFEVFKQFTNLNGIYFYDSEPLPDTILDEFYRSGRFPKLEHLFVENITLSQVQSLAKFAPILDNLSTGVALGADVKEYVEKHSKSIGLRRFETPSRTD